MNDNFTIVGFEYVPSCTIRFHVKSNSDVFAGKKILARIFDPYTGWDYWKDDLIFSGFGTLWIAPGFTQLITNQVQIEFYYENKIIFYDTIKLSSKINFNIFENFDFLKLYIDKFVSLAPFIEIFIDKIYDRFGFEMKEEDVVVDIGSNIGMFTHYSLSKKVKKIICCEPNPKAFSILENIFSTNPKVILNNFAISRKDRFLKLALPNYYEVSGGEFILSNEAVTWSNKNHNTVDVKGISFLDFIKLNNLQKIDFLKIDCEGGEYEIFVAENEIYFKENVKLIAMECHGDYNSIIEFFKKTNFIYEEKKLSSVLTLIWAKNMNG